MSTASRKHQIWGYARVSSTETDNLHKLLKQIYELMLTGVDAHYLLFDIGSENAANKPGLERLIQSVKAGSVDEIMVTELERIFHRLEDFSAFQQFLESFQVKLRVLNSSRKDDGTLNAAFFQFGEPTL